MSGLGHCFTHMKNHLLLSTSSLSSLVKIGGVSIEAPAISGWRGTDVWLSCFHATTAKPFFSVLWAGKDQGKVWTFLDENCFVESFFPLANCIYDVSICIYYIYTYVYIIVYSQFSTFWLLLFFNQKLRAGNLSTLAHHDPQRQAQKGSGTHVRSWVEAWIMWTKGCPPVTWRAAGKSPVTFLVVGH